MSSQALSQIIESVNNKIILIEKNIIPSSKDYLLFISYKIPYSNLVFVKKEEKFFSGARIEFELIHKGKIISRELINNDIYVNVFEDTKSNVKFIEDFISFRIDKDDYSILPTITIHNTKNSFLLDTINIDFSNFYKEKFYAPIIVEKTKNICIDSLIFKLINSQNSIPFSNNDYSLLIVVDDTTLKKVNIKIEQKEKIVYEEVITKFYESDLSINKCSDILGIKSKGSKVRYLIIENFNRNLLEGIAKLIINYDDNKKVDFYLPVKWINKPKALNDVGFAVEILNVIESKDVIMDMLNNSKNDLYESLLSYWDKKLPNRKYKFNELMYEFYNRVDYANENFYTITNKYGAKTDRGKIYIKYGKPDEITRDYIDRKVIEIWNYHNINKQFTFVDESGLGNFMLEN